jgi:hypothetical protein
MKRVDVRTYRKCHQLVTLRKKKVQPAATSGFCWYIPEHHETAEIVNGNAAILFEVGEILYQLRSREGKPPQGLYLIGRRNVCNKPAAEGRSAAYCYARTAAAVNAMPCYL